MQLGATGGDNTRVGDQLTATSLQFLFTLEPGALQSTVSFVRLILFQWIPQDTFQPPTLATAGTGILHSATLPHIAPYGHDSRFMFRVMWDKTFVVAPNNLIGDPPTTSTVSPLGERGYHIRKVMLKKIKNKKVQYTAGTTAGVNKLYLLAVGSLADGAGSDPVLTYWSKLNFRDS